MYPHSVRSTQYIHCVSSYTTTKYCMGKSSRFVPRFVLNTKLQSVGRMRDYFLMLNPLVYKVTTGLQRANLSSTPRASNPSLFQFSHQHFAIFSRLSPTSHVRASVDISADVLNRSGDKHVLQSRLNDI